MVVVVVVVFLCCGDFMWWLYTCGDRGCICTLLRTDSCCPMHLCEDMTSLLDLESRKIDVVNNTLVQHLPEHLHMLCLFAIMCSFGVL